MMLVALGVLVAALLVVALLPAYRARVRRLTSAEIRRTLPLTEAEIRADKDRLRAQFAIRVHKLEAESEQQKLAAARQRIEVNRRDARITELQDEVDRVRAFLEENVNARRVLEHTVTDSLPRLEQQLESARSMIKARDEELTALRSETNRSVRALDEALQINAQQRAELERMSSSQAARIPLPREAMAVASFEGELGLRSEVEALRAKNREHASLISRLQSGGEGVPAPADERVSVDVAVAADTAREASVPASFSGASDQAAEIARLKATLAVYEGSADAGDQQGSGQGSRLAAKARLSAQQAQLTQQTETIQRLRSELAASNERLARQAAHYMEEMRRLGAGTVPTTIDPRRGRDGARRTISDRIGQTSRSVSAATDGGAVEGETPVAQANRIAALAKPSSEAPLETDVAAALELGEAGGGAQPATAGAGASDAAGQPKRRLRLLERISSAGKG